MITVDRKAIDKLIKEMDLFKNTSATITDYKNELKKLEEKENQLKERLQVLQTSHTENTIALASEGEVNAIIALKRENNDLNNDSKIINSLLEGIEEEKSSLKIRYAPLYNQALRNDMADRQGKYNANKIVDVMRYEMLKAIVDIAKEMRKQYHEVSPDVLDLFEDKAVIESLVHKLRLNEDHYKPTYGEMFNTVISRQDIFAAVGGSMPQKFKNPNEVKK